MSQTEIETAIDEHCHCVGGIHHQFKLQWAAREPRWSASQGRYLLTIEVFSDAHVGSSTIHIVTHAGTNHADLLRLVDDALEEHLARGCCFSAANTPAMVSTPRARQS
jgi:hypothetical protein